MKKKELTYFVRFGSLNLNKQKGFGEKAFHSPPAPRGFYALPYTVQEFFLIGSLHKTQPHQFPKIKLAEYNEHWPKDEIEKWKDERDAVDWGKHSKALHRVKQNIRKEFRKVTRNIWHHLTEYCDNADVVARHNAWVKTSLKAWQKAFTRCCINMRYGEDGFDVNSINESPKTCGRYSKDIFEVFFDEKVN